MRLKEMTKTIEIQARDFRRNKDQNGRS